MRLLINLCRYCTRDPKECDYRNSIVAGTKAIKVEGTLTHHCPEYYKIIPIGQRVRVELHEIESGKTGGGYLELPEPYAKWISAGDETGTVIDRSGLGKGFMIVKLDQEHDLCLPVDKDWYKAKPRTVTHIRKRIKDLELLDEPLVVIEEEKGKFDF